MRTLRAAWTCSAAVATDTKCSTIKRWGGLILAFTLAAG